MRHGKQETYHGVLDIPEGESNGVRVKHMIKPPNTTLFSMNMRTAHFGQKGKKLVFEGETRWHELSEDKQGVWMTDLPIEQRQMDELIVKAKGHVLVGGLGLGYVVVALARRRQVRSITVVEKSADVIKLVWEPTAQRVLGLQLDGSTHRCPSLSIVHADLFEYLKFHVPIGVSSRTKPVFDWALFDIWQSDSEHTFHTMVAPLRRLAHQKVRELVCWNEDIMRGQLAQALESRRIWMKLGAAQAAAGTPMENVPTLDWLCEPHNMYHDWAIPFWQWYRDNKDLVSEQWIEWLQARYAWAYGRPERLNGVYLLDHVTKMAKWVPEPPADSV